MTFARVALRQSEHETWLEVVGVGRIPISDDTDDDFIGPSELVAQASLSSLRVALIAYAGAESPPPRSVTVVDPETRKSRVIRLPHAASPERCSVETVDADASKFFARRTYEFVPEPVAISLLTGGVLAARIAFVVEGEREPDRARVRTVLEPLLRRTKSTLVHVDADAQGEVDYSTTLAVTAVDFWSVHVYIAVPTRGRSVESALDIGRDALALLEAAETGAVTAETAGALIVSGRVELLVGQPESAWLECKGQPYARDERGQNELAKDVAALANSSGAGLIVLGFRTRRLRGTDTITGVSPVPRDDTRAERYRRWIAHRVHPRVVDLGIREVELDHGRIVIISVPRQPKALQPFLVRGAYRDGKITGTTIGVYTRVGDAVVATTVEELHALVVAGRAALGYNAAAEP